MDLRLTFTFSPRNTGTQVHAHSELHPKGVMRLLAPVMMPMLKHMFSKRPAQLAAALAASKSAHRATRQLWDAPEPVAPVRRTVHIERRTGRRRAAGRRLPAPSSTGPEQPNRRRNDNGRWS
jgi:hypothetical protein